MTHLPSTRLTNASGVTDPDAVSRATVQRFYRYHARVYDFTRWAILHGRRRAVRCLDLRPDARVLEMGCGTGLNFRHLLHHLDPNRGGYLVGLDFSSDMLRRAESRIRAQGWPHVELLRADATTLNLDRRFDAILFAYSLSMIPDWRAALDRARSHLEPGGRIVVLDFGHFHGWGPLGRLVRAWLRWNHVHATQPYAEGFRERFVRTRVIDALGGYYFIAVGQRAED